MTMRSLCKGLPVRRKVLSLAGLDWPRLSEQAKDDLRGAVPELAGTSARQLSSFLQHLPPFLSSIASSSSIHQHHHIRKTCLPARESRMLRRKRSCRHFLARAARKRKKSKAILTSLASPFPLILKNRINLHLPFQSIDLIALFLFVFAALCDHDFFSVFCQSVLEDSPANAGCLQIR